MSPSPLESLAAVARVLTGLVLVVVVGAVLVAAYGLGAYEFDNEPLGLLAVVVGACVAVAAGAAASPLVALSRASARAVAEPADDNARRGSAAGAVLIGTAGLVLLVLGLPGGPAAALAGAVLLVVGLVVLVVDDGEPDWPDSADW